MLETIKSFLCIKLIFLNLSNEKKLKIIKENKKLKKMLNVNLLDYKLVSCRYLIIYNNGYGKEYNSYNNQLIFEGEYFDRQRNGYGKEYNKINGKLLFEGKYINGKGKEYYTNGPLKFEGIYFFGRRYNGRGYGDDGSVLYELVEGKGNMYDLEYIINYSYSGQYLNGEGAEYFKNNKIKFKGIFFNGLKWTGYGYNSIGQIIYALNNGNGKVKELDCFGNLIFVGQYKYGKRNGVGKEFRNNFVKFEGEYLNGERKGKGKEYKDKSREILFEGIYLYDNRIKGKEYHKIGKLDFEGEYLFNKKWNGKGYDENGNIIYELKHGNGKVKEYDDNDRLIFEGQYIEGKRFGKWKKYNNNKL